MKDMSAIYYNMSTIELRRLKSKKYVRWEKLARDKSNHGMREKRELIQQIRWIDAVLASRGSQLELF